MERGMLMTVGDSHARRSMVTSIRDVPNRYKRQHVDYPRLNPTGMYLGSQIPHGIPHRSVRR